VLVLSQAAICGGAWVVVGGKLPGPVRACRLVVVSLVLNYVLANAAVSRSFSPYFASLLNLSPDYFVVQSGSYQLDFWAFGLCIAFSLLLCWGMKETKTFNNGAPPPHSISQVSEGPFASRMVSPVHSRGGAFVVRELFAIGWGQFLWCG
jgi:hypothetical protein